MGSDPFPLPFFPSGVFPAAPDPDRQGAQHAPKKMRRFLDTGGSHVTRNQSVNRSRCTSNVKRPYYKEKPMPASAITVAAKDWFMAADQFRLNARNGTASITFKVGSMSTGQAALMVMAGAVSGGPIPDALDYDLPCVFSENIW